MPEVIPDLVSTIIPVYNRPDMLREAVQCVLDQTYRPIEIIIVDDGSTDDTPQVARQLVEAHPDIVRFHGKANSGAGPSREAGRQMARGEFIQYLDSDDLLLPDKFRLHVDALRQNPQCGAAYGWIKLQKEDGSQLPHPYKCSGEERATLFPWLLSDRWWNTNAPLWRRTTCDAMGAWSDLRWSQDWEYDARAAAMGTQLAYVAQYVTVQRQHADVRQTTGADWSSRDRVQNRVDFFTRMFAHAERAGIPATDPHRKHFARWVFATARTAASAGLREEAGKLMALAERSAADQADACSGFRVFRMATRLAGWHAAGKLFSLIQRLKSPGSLTLAESFSRVDSV